MKALRRIGFMVALTLLTSAAAAGELRLLMIDRVGCEWCEAWDREIGPVYPKTEAGRRAPLIRSNIRAALPEGVTLDRPARFTPTFVLLRDGAEIGRIDGYPGEDFFWGLLEQLIARAPGS